MRINLLYNQAVKQWRWTLIDTREDGKMEMAQESGSRSDFRDAMNDVANTVEYLLDRE
jgi:hypothetical protein